MRFPQLPLLAIWGFVSFTSGQTVISTSHTDLGIDPQGSAQINAGTFQQDAIVSFGNHQYVTFYTDRAYNQRYVNLARRKISPSVEAWETITFRDYLQTTLDGHNQISMGISGDGYIHLSFDHHDDPLRYRVSNANVAANVPSEWTISLFGPVINSLPGSSGPFRPVTYPRFELLPGGDLLFGCRIGRSGDGTLHLHRYSTTSRQWTALGPYIASNSNNAYLNGISAAAGRVFASWTVRETPNANTNHDFHFAYSNDEGVTWFNTNGKQLPKPFLADNADTKVFEIPQNSRLVNQESQIVDNAGRFHALMRDDLSGSQSYNHYYRDLAGRWTKRVINASLNGPAGLFHQRGKLALDSTGTKLFAILPDNTTKDTKIYVSTARGNFEDWRHLATIPKTAGEPGFDDVRLEKFEVLSIYTRQDGGYPNRKVQVWDFQLDM